MTQKHIRHVVMRKYRKHEDAITMSKAIGKSLSQISTVHQFRIHLNIGSHDNCNIVVCSEFENDEIFQIYSQEPGHQVLREKVKSFGYPVGTEFIDYYTDEYSCYIQDENIHCILLCKWEQTPKIEVIHKLEHLTDIPELHDLSIHLKDRESGNNNLIVEFSVKNIEELSKCKSNRIYLDICSLFQKNNIEISQIDY